MLKMVPGCDGRTDRRTDGIAIAITHYSNTC